MALIDCFRLTENAAATHTWALVSHDPAVLPADALADELADRIVRFQCRGAIQHYRAWKAKSLLGSPLSDSAKRAVEAFLAPVFGTPSNPDAVPKDHLEGYVGQMLWYFLCEERRMQESICRIEPPGFKSTDPGGDSLVVHRLPDTTLMFRLWEMKKFVPISDASNSSVASTVNTAYSQLDGRALEYLARYTGICQEQDDPELRMLYGQLVDLWVDASEQAAAGVSVATCLSQVPQRCFETFGQRFPRFATPVRLRGMLTAIGDFAAFACRVRECIWSGL